MRILLLLVVLAMAWAQFPAVCNTQDSLSTKTCCPNNCGSTGTCVSIRKVVERSWKAANATVVKFLKGELGRPQDVRYQWPLKIFERVCSCHEGWGGYDCSHCDFGFIANAVGECVKRNADQLLVRRNFKNLSKQERLNYVRLVDAAKNQETKEWAIISKTPEEPNGHYELQNVTTYDMIEFTHFLSIREKVSPFCESGLKIDEFTQITFAHKGTPFLPWHRYFTLQYEAELRQIGERLGISGFTLPYWDWAPADTCLLFTHELFGVPEYSDELVNVTGTLFEKGNWPVVCDAFYRAQAEKQNITVSATECAKERTLCDVEDDRKHNRPLQRGFWAEPIRGLSLPDEEAVAMTLIPDQFEGTYRFARRLEGSVAQCTGEPVKCILQHSSYPNPSIHAAVHAYIGGQLSVGGAACNDPLFFLHHGNVDRIFERWLRKYNGDPPSYQPVSGGSPGHNLNDYIVPIFPLKTIADVYKESTFLGYTYDDLPWSIPKTDYQIGCPSEHCNKRGYQPTVRVNSTSADCVRIRMDQDLNEEA